MSEGPCKLNLFILQVFAQVKKGEDQQLFVYSVQKCYATTSQSLRNYQGLTDVFFENQCPIDETMDWSVVGGLLFLLKAQPCMLVAVTTFTLKINQIMGGL